MAVPAFRAAILAAACATAASAGGLAAPKAALDQNRIHGLYHDGEFDKVVRALDGYVKGSCSCAHADSVFAEKHLAVVLAANPATRELGRYHMYRLLDLAPGGDLLDMFVGEEVDAVFDKVRKEHAIRSAAAPKPAPAAPPAAAAPAPAAVPAPRPKGYSDAWAQVSDLPDRAPSPEARAVSMDWARMPARPAAPSRHAAQAPAWSDIPRAKTSHRAPRAAEADKPRILRVTQPAPVPAAAFRKPQAPSPVAPSSRPAVMAPAAARSAAQETDSSATQSPRPAWKQAGLWIGGGAALAAVAFTFIHAGGNGGGAKTYAVPATVSK